MEEIEQLNNVKKAQSERISLLEQLIIEISKKVSYLEDRLVDQASRSMKDNVVMSPFYVAFPISTIILKVLHI